MRAYRGFNQDMTWRGFHYEEGVEYTDPKSRWLWDGFDACVEPLDVLACEDPSESVYHAVDVDDATPEPDRDSTVLSGRMVVGRRLSTGDMIKTGMDVLRDRIQHHKWQRSTFEDSHPAFVSEDFSAAQACGTMSAACVCADGALAVTLGDGAAATVAGFGATAAALGDGSTASASGNDSVAAASGDSAIAATSGDGGTASTSGDSGMSATAGYSAVAAAAGRRSVAATSGTDATAVVTGPMSIAATAGHRAVAVAEGTGSIAIAGGTEAAVRGTDGCWLVLVERGTSSEIVAVKAVQVGATVDGIRINPDTLYSLADGKIVEVKMMAY